MRTTIFKYAIYLIIRIFNALFLKKRVYLGDSKKYVTTGGCIIASWHQNIIFMEGVKFHKGGALLSASRDGDYMLKIFKHKGWRAFRGSSSRGGLKAMEQIINHFNNVEDDMTFIITPDGPRGPGFKSKRGMFQIAKETGKPIIPAVPYVKKFKTVNSWDQHKIPYPFQTCYHVFGEPIFISPDESDLSFKSQREHYDLQMKKLSKWQPNQ